ncbi:MAG: hypothetical protein COX43_03800 [Parcubacteria group bacterium CG23_combo_of_CG06-09_8_20_14_all_35_9]|nr:MAG: hypothetical protein COX43_03800 [Parcubacteria group bacterium CG23_combo_of_CG06-09_8_20_14_all_35_9]
MNINDGFMILAVLCSPFLAVYVQSKIDLNREKRRKRLWVFHTLMATRGDKISLNHVQALNSIELYFDDTKKDKGILEKWNEYLDHLVHQNINESDKDYSTRLDHWAKKADELLSDVLYIMSKSLGYDFDKVKIKRGIYIPKGHGDERYDNLIIRKRLSQILQGKDSLPIKVIETDKGE